MWLLFLVFAAAASGQRDDIIDTTHLDLAMTGFDAFCVNSFIQPDPGRRSKLLQPLRSPINAPVDEVLVSQFIHEVEAAKCFPELSIQTAINYIELQKFAISSAYQLSNDINSEPSSLRYDNSALCGSRSNFRDRDMINFFKDTGGEVIFVYAECVTRVITIDPFQPLTFTSEFETVLVKLYKAALDPSSKISEKTFSDFVWSYGTHFSKRTHLGAKAIFGKRFPSRSATPGEQTTRRRCVLEAAREALMSCTRWCDDTTLTRFAKASSEGCLEKEQDVFAEIIGPLPKGSLENWALQAEELPDPIFNNLEPITTLFEREWMSSHPEVKKMNKTTLWGYFGNKLEDHTNKMLTGGFGQPQLKGCGLNSRCDPGAECINEPDAKSGHRCKPRDWRIIIVGGWKDDWKQSIPYIEVLFGPRPPPFPVAVYLNTLSRAGGSVYSCGGYDSSGKVFKKCWVIDTETEGAVWHSFDIPWELAHHSAVVVQDEIWFFLDSTLRILDTRNPANETREISLGFSVDEHICAVAHGSKTFLIGAGVGGNEVHVNSDHSKPQQWVRFSTMLQGRHGFMCHEFGRELFVTGGYAVGNGSRLSSVEAISVVDGTVRSTGPLGGVRREHQMAIIEGRLAVLGGFDGANAMATIETYDEQTNSWETLGRTLPEPRYYFGLTQFLP